MKTSRCALGRTGVGVSVDYLEARPLGHGNQRFGASGAQPSGRRRASCRRIQAEELWQHHIGRAMVSTDVPANKVVAGNSTRPVKSWID